MEVRWFRELGFALSIAAGVLVLAPGPSAVRADTADDLATLTTAKFRPAAEQGVENEYLVILEREGVEKRLRGVSRRALATAANQLAHEYGFEVIESWQRIVPMMLVQMDPWTARALADDPRVTLVEQNRRMELDRPLPEDGPEADPFNKQVCDTPSSPQAITGCPNPGPTGCTDNWGLDRIDALPGQPFDDQYSWQTSGFGVHVFVFDVGLQANHCEIAGRVPDDPNARVSRYSHGTRVASLIGGTSLGVAKDVTFHNVKAGLAAGDANGNLALTTRQVLSGFELIAERIVTKNIGAAVINASWNLPKLSSDPFAAPNVVPGAVSLAARTLVEDFGVTLVVSAGNRGTSPLDFTPSDLGYVEGVIVVGGTNAVDQRWTRDPSDPICAPGGIIEGDCGSNFGPGIDLWAPADWIYSATRDDANTASPLSGTSFAAPHVTGAVARLLQFNPDLSPRDVEATLKAHALVGELSGIDVAPNLLLNVRNLPTVVGAAPVARTDHAMTMVDTPVDVDVLYNDLDRDGNHLILVDVSNPARGSAAIIDGQVRYTPDNNITGTDSFTYTVSDGGLTTTALVTVVVDPDLPPVAIPDHRVFPLPGGQQPPNLIVFREPPLRQNDVDPEGGGIIHVLHGPIDCGHIDTITNEELLDFAFDPDVTTCGPNRTYRFDLTVKDQFTGTDGTDHTDTAEVRLRTYIPGSGDPPTAVRDDAYLEPPDLSVTLNVLANDTDDGNVLTLIDVEQPRRGSVSFQSNGWVTYQRDPDFEGWDGFTYVIQDSDGNLGAESVVVQVGGNQPPSTFDRAFSTDVNQAQTIYFADLLGSNNGAASDPDSGDTVMVSSWGQPTAGTGSVVGGTDRLTFIPPSGFEGNSVFTYTVTDGRGGFDTAWVLVQVGEPTGDFDDGSGSTCRPPGTGNWVVNTSCVFQGTATAPGSVIVQNGATLTIASGSTLDIAFHQRYLLVRDGCRVIVKAGGKIH